MEQSMTLMSAQIHFVVSRNGSWPLAGDTWTDENRHLRGGLDIILGRVKEAPQSADSD